MEDNERWLSDGDCSKCRRQSYCKKPCTVKKRRYRQLIRDFILNKTGIAEVKDAIDDAVSMAD